MHILHIRWPLTGVKFPKIGKRGLRGEKLPFPIAPENGALTQTNPHFSTGYHKENGDFLDSGAIGNGSFLTPKPSFPILGTLTPVGCQRIRNACLIQACQRGGCRYWGWQVFIRTGIRTMKVQIFPLLLQILGKTTMRGPKSCGTVVGFL